jgi:hypothetical protein
MIYRALIKKATREVVGIEKVDVGINNDGSVPTFTEYLRNMCGIYQARIHHFRLPRGRTEEVVYGWREDGRNYEAIVLEGGDIGEAGTIAAVIVGPDKPEASKED